MLTILENPCAVQEPALTTAEQFFYDHAGWSYDPVRESPEQGRRWWAKRLAKAEKEIRELKGFLGYGWEPDPDGDREDCFICILYVGQYWNGTGMVDNPTLAHKRVVEAELADEYLCYVWEEQAKP